MAASRSLRVPPRQVAAVEALRDLSEADFATLVETLATGPIDPNGMREAVANAIPVLSPEEAQNAVDMLLALDRVRYERGETPEELAEALGEADGMPGDEAQREVAVARLRRLLGSPALRLTSKALDLLYSNERNFVRSRIVSEIRPIFGDDPSEMPRAAVVAHRLEIEFVDPAGHNRTMQFALDQDDLATLRSSVARAEAKAAVMESVVQQGGLVLANPLEPDEEP